LTLRHTDLRYELGGDFSALDATGSVRVEAIDLQHPFIRTRQFNVHGQLAYERKSLEDRQGATGFINERRIAGRTIGLSVDARDGWLGGGFSLLTVAMTASELDLLTPAIALSDQSAGGRFTQGAFSKTGYTLSRMQAMGGPWTLSFNLSGQTASRNLEGSEKMALGGPGGVRAYAIGEGASDQGWITQTELRRAFGDPAGQSGLNMFAFYDAGRSRINRNPAPGDTIDRIQRSGYGLGLETRRFGSFVLRATAAWRDDAGSANDTSINRSPRIYVQGSLFF
jgi:hemolysin activation/secretion protein